MSKMKLGKKRIISLLLVMVMLLGCIPVTAGAFEASPGDVSLFSAGEFGDGTTDSQDDPLFSDSPDSTVPGGGNTDVTPTPPAATPVPPEVTPTPEITPTPEVTPTPPVVSPTPTPGDRPSGGEIQIGDPLTIRFADNKGTKFYEELQIETTMGETVVIPDVPGFADAEGSGWKLDKDIPDTSAILIEGGRMLKLSLDEDLPVYIVNGVLTLYAVEGEEMCTVTFYNNSGTGIFSGGKMKVVKGTTIMLPDFPNSKYVNFGWTTTKSGRTVQYKLGEKYTVNRNMNLYIIRYATSKVADVRFFGPTGSYSSTYAAMAAKVVKGEKLKLPAVPNATGYANLGWSTKKNATSATYLAGSSIKITKNLNLYAVRKKLPTYTVTFNNNSGTSTSKTYSKLNQKVAKNSYIILPDVPKASGYQNLGWTTTKNGSKPVYAAGSKIKVTKSIKFYAVRRKSKYYTVSFYYGNGKYNSYYKALQKKVEEGTTITLPDVPDKSGYLNMGWSTKKNPTSVTNREGTKYYVTKSTNFYAVQSQSVSVILYKNSGVHYKTIQVGKGAYVKLPGVTSIQPYTFMGWSKKPNQNLDPEYQAGEVLKVENELHLYAVVFNRNTQEPDITKAEIAKPDLQKYKQVIFVGDSRTNRMNRTLTTQFGTSVTDGVKFISQEGGGLTWLRSAGYLQLMSLLGNQNASILENPTAVVFNLGVNDLSSVSSYVTYMRDLAKELKLKGCKLFYMSVNPVNSKMIDLSGHASRNEADVRLFNQNIKSELCSDGTCTYIDTYSMLMKTGYGTDGGKYGTDIGVDDGLHYTTKTYKRIYNYCMNELNKFSN